MHSIKMCLSHNDREWGTFRGLCATSIIQFTSLQIQKLDRQKTHTQTQYVSPVNRIVDVVIAFD